MNELLLERRLRAMGIDCRYCYSPYDQDGPESEGVEVSLTEDRHAYMFCARNQYVLVEIVDDYESKPKHFSSIRRLAAWIQENQNVN